MIKLKKGFTNFEAFVVADPKFARICSETISMFRCKLLEHKQRQKNLFPLYLLSQTYIINFSFRNFLIIEIPNTSSGFSIVQFTFNIVLSNYFQAIC